MVNKAVKALENGQKIVISCYSGRGRSGTLSSIVLGKIKRVATHKDLVDLIVEMRESRDGLLETPEQYRYVARMLKLPDPALLHQFQDTKGMKKIDDSNWAIVVFVLIFSFCWYVMKK